MFNLQNFKNTLDDFIKTFNVPSCSITIYDHGKYESLNLGFYNIEEEKIPDENTLYAIGSSTKSFVAGAISLLVHRGLLDLDKPVKEYLPDFNLYDDYVANTLLVRDILCHRCGLPRHDFTWYSVDQSELDFNYMYSRLKYLKPFAPVRSEFSYQNHMYMIAGHLISKVTSMPWDEFIKKEILQPLNLNANFKIQDLKNNDNKAFPYRFDKSSNLIKKINYKDIYNIAGPAGSMNSSSKEMAKWIAFQLNLGKVDGIQIIPENMVKECHKPQMIVQNIPELPEYDEINFKSYGLGWFLENYRGKKLVHHGGNIDGFSSLAFFIPGESFGASILTNADGFLGINWLMYTMLDEYFGFSKINWLSRCQDVLNNLNEKRDVAVKGLLESVPKDTKPSHDLKDYSGTYFNDGYGSIEISLKEDTLNLTYGIFNCSLIHLCYDSFVIIVLENEDLKVPCSFNIGMLGNICSLSVDFEPAIGPIVFNKIVDQQ